MARVEPGPVTGHVPPKGWAACEPMSVGGEVWPEVWRSRTFQASVRQVSADGWLWISMKRLDKKPMGWRAMQVVKNALVGPEREAVEVHPAESRLVDTSNQYHLFVLPRGQRFPFGFQERAVVDGTGETAPGKARQEPLGPGKRHGPVMTQGEAEKRTAQYVTDHNDNGGA